MARNPKVGYRKPPKSTQFKKGRSGNPNGRPKGVRNLATELQRELKEKITVHEGGKTKQVSKRVGILKSVIAKGLQGDIRATNTVMALSERLSKDEPPPYDDTLSGDELEILCRVLPSLQNLTAAKRCKDDN